MDMKKLYKIDRTKIVKETTVHTHLKRVVEEEKGLIFKNHPITNRGIPDVIIHCRGMTFYVEEKTTGEKCTASQERFHKMLKDRGIETYVLDTKINSFWDIMQVGYTTYEGKHFNKYKET